MTDKFDFEEDMMNCWHVVDDIKQLAAMVTDRNASTDNIAKVLLGLQVLYNDRFTQLMDGFMFVQNNIDTSWVESERARKDNTVTAEMIDQYSILKQEIKEQKTIENPKGYQKEDLKYNEKFLDAVETMLKHYTVRSEWPEELKDAENG
jgi:hypothetical protein|tara:strand:- start:292 stop:738 length:447 start_codon:yes stop_codon:yes gene_type:complete